MINMLEYVFQIKGKMNVKLFNLVSRANETTFLVQPELQCNSKPIQSKNGIMMNFTASAKNQMTATFVEMIICRILVRVIEGEIKYVKQMNIYRAKFVHARNFYLIK